MIQETAISMIQEWFDAFGLTFSLYFEDFDPVSSEIDAPVLCILDVFF
jgi:hypothetical protein